MDNQAYEQLQDKLMQLELPITAAELQGILVGLYAAGMPLNQVDWLEQLYQYISDDPATQSAISGQVKAMQQQLKQELMEAQGTLTQLMPEDDAFIIDRAEALVYWCQGFLLGYESLTANPTFDDENTREAYDDLKTLTQLDLDSIKETEEDEKALYSLQEHSRVSALLVFHSQASANPADNKLH